MKIRVVQEKDASELLHLMKKISGETSFMLWESDEITLTVEQQREQIKSIYSQEKHLLLVVERNKQLVGYLVGTRGGFRRNMHTLTIAVGILQTFTGQGIGTQLFLRMEQWARQKGITRLDLTVMEPNQTAIALYTKCGFGIEGIKKRSMFVNGNYVDEYIMGKLLT